MIVQANISGGGDATITDGTSANQTIRWNGSAWTPSSALTNDGSIITAASLKVTNLAGGGSEIVTTSNDGSIGSTTFSSKGSILVFDGVDIVVLTAGTNGQYLSANSTTASGLEWVTGFTLPSGGAGQTLRYTAATTVVANSFLYNDGTKIGVNITTPANLLHIDGGNATATYLQITAGTTTGQLSTDGFHVGIDTSGIAEVRQRENLAVVLYTNGAIRANWDANGRFASNSTQNVIYRTTNGGSNTNSHFMIDPAGSVSAGNAFAFDATNGFVLTAANGTRRIAVSAINVTNITTTAGSEKADFSIYVKPSGAAITERVKVTAEGSVLTAVAGALATNATDGFLYIPTCAGTPTGVPTAQTGMVAMVYDSTNNKLYIYDGSWLGGTTPGAFT